MITVSKLRQMAIIGICLLATSNAVQNAGAASASASLAIQADQPGPKISPMLYGIFFEEINCAGDGGIYAELVRNRSFEDANKPEHWSIVTGGDGKGQMSIDTTHPLSAGNQHSLKLEVTDCRNGRAGVANDGYWGMSLNKGESYDFSMSARASAGFTGPLTISLETRDGKTLARKKISGLSTEWNSFKASLKPEAADTAARLVISLSQPGTVWLDMVSVFPRKTWKGRPNGLRSDLAQKLNDLKPGFVRFPGGCWVEGDTLKFAYRWKETIGNVSTRRNQYNIWQYYSTHGLGYHEYLQMCEDLSAEPLFVVNCGMSHKENVPMDQLGPWVQDALDAIEYANGPATSQWGSMRAKNGHPAPFHLNYLEIGNENGGPAYHERYAVFYQAIKQKHPQMNLIADEWQGIPRSSPVEIIDEHYYSSPTFFIQNANRYDSYKRTGPKVYVGEYAVTQNCGQGNLRGALGEAAFMTGMERNSDVVVMSSYAPLFANINYKKWNPDLINFNSSRVYGTPSYYVQKLFSENQGDVVLPLHINVESISEEPNHGAIGLGTWETQAEYKDIKVTDGDKVIFNCNGESTNGWRVLSGNWQANDGALQQTARGADRRLLTGDSAWRDYTLSLKARKLGGAEGFLIMFHVQDGNNWLWWNLGGWANSKHAIEQCSDGGKAILGGDVSGKIETGRWYDIRIELKGSSIRCYLDDKLVHDTKDSRQWQPLHAVASRLLKSGEVIVKAVNVANTDYDTAISLNGVKKVRPSATATVLTSLSPADENSIDQPLKVAPVQKSVKNAASNFRYTFPANSVTVLRLKAEK